MTSHHTSTATHAGAQGTANAAAVARHLLATVACEQATASHTEIMHAVAQVAREQLSQRWVEGDTADRQAKARRVYYLSMEFLIGRTLSNALAALDLKGEMGQAARDHACTLEDLASTEADAALGNGGLGRLAACFLDSMATLELPSFGYGIRYEFGMFKQSIQGGGRSSTRTPGWKTARPGSFRARACTTRCVLAAGWNRRPHPASRPPGALRARSSPRPTTW
jgi:starch phosphorylase